ncbi:MAG: competence/damage-inducible protein A [Bacteroidales bacterium]|nr:competence/damage-inducible protein A [Bacteroidales bacterium]
MNAAIVTIGDEILIGQITDTNSGWIARKLTAIGLHVSEMVSISDSTGHITSTLDRLSGRVQVIILTGGLGPTKDDLTKQVLADYFGARLVMDQDILMRIEEFFSKRGRKMIESNRLQAMVPDKCTALRNDHGTAPGMWFRNNNTHVISMPGVPYEMKPMVENEVIPGLKRVLKIPELVHKTIMTQGVPESYLAEMIRDWENNLPECLKLAYLPRPGIVRLRLTATGKCAEEAQKMIQDQIDKLLGIIPEHIYGYDDLLLEKSLGDLLKDKKATVSTAESCTGGNIARLITSIPGSSSYYKGSIIAYSNEVKASFLEVGPKLLEEFGAVSQQVTEAMAIGALGKMKSDYSIATSGIAGPDGGTEEKPVGTVWIAVAGGNNTYSRVFRFGGHRELVIEQSSIMAMGILRKFILEMIP